MQKIEILGIKVNNIDKEALLAEIENSITESKRLYISYANANSINLSYKNKNFKKLLDSFDIVHPDGIGILLASKILSGGDKLKTRFSGSDFYPELAEKSIKNNWRIFFFGHTDAILEKIKLQNPKINICGTAEGYSFNPVKIAAQINDKVPDILIIGLGQPLQEEMISFYRDFINCSVIMAVGDGIKVFAGEKRRGPIFMQKIGLEWLSRLIRNPLKYGKRYLLGNPLFLYRIIRAKLGKFNS
ncbi:MAG TPA: WecB/TagA/CpsF family glycosyltransferase [Ignavibacteria bacterium]|jgi:N-acetylglucosaminyldiphosphoundecaprenol N-acetyl-beta-D-mannosaminyltransferase